MSGRNNTNNISNGVNKFIELEDVNPHNYVGDAGMVYIVNNDENGLTPVTVSSIVNVGSLTENTVPIAGDGTVGNILRNSNISESDSGCLIAEQLTINGSLGQFTFPSNKGFSGDVIVSGGDGTTSWGSSSSYNPGYWVIPWTSWQYFCVTMANSGNAYWTQASGQNAGPFTAGPQGSWGTAPFIAPVDGTYQFTVNQNTSFNQGIANFTINGVQTPFDSYAIPNGLISLVWTQTLTAGTYNIGLDTLTQNPSSSGYFIGLCNPGLQIQFVPP